MADQAARRRGRLAGLPCCYLMVAAASAWHEHSGQVTPAEKASEEEQAGSCEEMSRDQRELVRASGLGRVRVCVFVHIGDPVTG